jgi:hypothetical protein
LRGISLFYGFFRVSIRHLLTKKLLFCAFFCAFFACFFKKKFRISAEIPIKIDVKPSKPDVKTPQIAVKTPKIDEIGTEIDEIGENDPKNVKNDPKTVENDPTLTENDPTLVEKDPKSIKNGPKTVEIDPKSPQNAEKLVKIGPNPPKKPQNGAQSCQVPSFFDESARKLLPSPSKKAKKCARTPKFARIVTSKSGNSPNSLNSPIDNSRENGGNGRKVDRKWIRIDTSVCGSGSVAVSRLKEDDDGTWGG